APRISGLNAPNSDPLPASGAREGEGHSRLIAQFGDDPERPLAAGDALEIVEGIAPPLPVIVPGRTGAVRAEYRVVHCKQLMIGLGRLFDHDVEPGAQDLLVAQRHIERLLVDHRTT